jgi:hypothetical protein
MVPPTLFGTEAVKPCYEFQPGAVPCPPRSCQTASESAAWLSEPWLWGPGNRRS